MTMNKWYRSFVLFSVVFVAACVTINVYFPAAEMESAAEKIVKEALKDDESTDNGAGENDQSHWRSVPSESAWAAINPINWLIGTAQAQSVDITSSSPAINALTQKINDRYNQSMKAYLNQQVIGFGNDGFVAVINDSALGLKDRQQLKKLVLDENRDRTALYREVAIANAHPEWEDQVRQAFVKKWIEGAKAGWKYQNANGQWVSK